MNRDRVYHQKQETIKRFEFNEAVADVFDDMVNRSIPFYNEIHRLIIDIIEKSFINNSNIYDLGCSTGSTISLISKLLEKQNVTFYGVDNSAPMLEKCRSKLQQKSNINLICKDISDVEIENASAVIMNYTLQFISPSKRPSLIQKISDGLKPGGVFILSEKIVSQSFDPLVTDLYYNFKRRNGYSELEISQKRDALENVLIPITPKEHITQLKENGFEKVEMIFRWYNFASFLAIKQ